MAKKKPKAAFKPVSSGLPTSMAFQGFTPYRPPAPPTGSYDPALNAQLGASQRGLEDLRQDTGTANLRAGVDYGLDRDDITRQRDRGFVDFDTARDRGLEDYSTQTTALNRAFTQLGRRQAEGQRAAGVLSGGIALQAAAKRAENQGIEQRGLDVNRDRFLADNTLGRARLGEDAAQSFGRLDLGYQRGGIDRGTQLTRGEREGKEFGLDVDEMKGFQASQYGWEPPPPPKNQGVNKKGTAYIERPVGNWIVRYDQYGNEMSRRRKPGSGSGGSGKTLMGTVSYGRSGL